jgi:hypothetical protein
MSKNRFKNLKRFFHVSPPIKVRLPRCQWVKKLQPLSDILREAFQRHILPATSVSIDEMMVRFTGRSVHTTVIKGKPIPEGYKILALCERGYTYSFMYTSRVDSFSDLNTPAQPFNGAPSLCKTSRAVLQMCLQLPYQAHRFILYCDNYFSNIPLFSVLRQYGIAACGTVRPNSAGYPKELKVDKRRANLSWGMLAGSIVNNVLAFVWQDKNLVRFLTTAFPGDFDDVEMAERRRPRTTPQNRTLVQTVWGVLARRWLALPTASVRYNFHMGGVDIADQRRSYYSTQLRTVRNWLPLFFWLLDCTIINAYILCAEVFKGSKIPCLESHRFFRIRLAWNLVIEGANMLNPRWVEALSTEQNPKPNGAFCPGARPLGNNAASRYAGYVGKRYEATPFRFAPGKHKLDRFSDKSQKHCVFCRMLRQNNLKPTTERNKKLEEIFQRSPQKGKIKRTCFGCSICKVPLCKDFCFTVWHTVDWNSQM